MSETPTPAPQEQPQAPAVPVAPEGASETTEPKAAEPVNYDLKLPEGSHLDAEAVKGIVEFARAKKITPEAAQALLERENANFAAYVERQKQQVETEKNSWIEASSKDKEIGGENAKAAAELSKRALQRLMNDRPEFLKELEDTGIGNHPEFARLMYRVGKMLGDDRLVVGGAQDATSKTMEDIFYPKAESK